MWNLRHRAGSNRTDVGTAGPRQSGTTSACRATLRRVVLLAAAMALLPTVWSVSRLTTPAAGMAWYEKVTDDLQCPADVAGDHSDTSKTLSGYSNGANTETFTPAVPTCEQYCARIQQVYHEAHTQDLLILLAQTPTGQDALDYLLAMGAHFGDAFITWRDLRADGLVGKNNAGGFIQLNSATHTENAEVIFFMAGILVHEAVESSFEVGEGIRVMATRHTDYVAQWFAGKFERELHALPSYHRQDPFYDREKNSAYGLSYATWLHGTDDGRAYLGNPEQPDLRQSDRKGHAWPPTDWWAEQGGFWFLGQGTDVTPVPNPLGLTPAMLTADDLSMMD
jgi:hypothetical protein